MDLQQIKYFLAVVDSGTFLAASKHVHVSQPTLSAGIRKLEESLDVTLFHRGSRAASLTPAGQQFLGPARQSYNQLLTIKSQLAAQPQKIVIGVSRNIHMDYVARIVSIYRAANPHMVIEFVIADHEELSKKLQARELDLIVSKSHAGAKGFIPLIEERLCIAVPREHRFAKESALSLKALTGEFFIERVNCSFWSKVNQVFQEESIEPHVVMRAESDEFVLSMVAANLGVSIISYRETPYDISFIPIKGFCIDSSIGVYTPAESEPHIQDFCSTIMKQFC